MSGGASRKTNRVRGESLPSRADGEIAQLVEHTTENRGVPGSSPGLAIARRRGARNPARSDPREGCQDLALLNRACAIGDTTATFLERRDRGQWEGAVLGSVPIDILDVTWWLNASRLAA